MNSFQENPQELVKKTEITITSNVNENTDSFLKDYFFESNFFLYNKSFLQKNYKSKWVVKSSSYLYDEIKKDFVLNAIYGIKLFLTFKTNIVKQLKEETKNFSISSKALLHKRFKDIFIYQKNFLFRSHQEFYNRNLIIKFKPLLKNFDIVKPHLLAKPRNKTIFFNLFLQMKKFSFFHPNFSTYRFWVKHLISINFFGFQFQIKNFRGNKRGKFLDRISRKIKLLVILRKKFRLRNKNLRIIIRKFSNLASFKYTSFRYQKKLPKKFKKFSTKFFFNKNFKRKIKSKICNLSFRRKKFSKKRHFRVIDPLNYQNLRREENSFKRLFFFKSFLNFVSAKTYLKFLKKCKNNPRLFFQKIVIKKEFRFFRKINRFNKLNFVSFRKKFKIIKNKKIQVKKKKLLKKKYINYITIKKIKLSNKKKRKKKGTKSSNKFLPSFSTNKLPSFFLPKKKEKKIQKYTIKPFSTIRTRSNKK